MSKSFRALVLLLVAGTAFACTSSGSGGKSSSGQLRVMSYNIHHAAGMDQKLDIPRIANIIREHNPAFVALQEVDRGVKRSDRKDQATEIGTLAKMHAFFGKAVDWDGGDYGGAVLSRWPIISSKVWQLPVTGGREPRVAVMIRVNTPPAAKLPPQLTFVGVHLEHQHEGDRLAQAKKLKQILDALPDQNVILAGDFNAQPDDAAIGVFTKAGWTNVSGKGHTFPAPYPLRKIDWIFVRENAGWNPRSADVVAERVASDHRPVITDLQWKPTKK